MLTNRRVVAAKIEAVEGTKETLAAADGGILALGPKVDVDIKMTPRKPIMATMSKLEDIPGSQLARITFSLEMKGRGTAYSSSNLPALDKYLKACGFAATVDTTIGAEKVTYKPASTGIPCLTIGCYEDGVIKTIYGARGNVRFEGRNGEPIMAHFDFLGIWDGATDGAMLSPTYEGTKPPAFLNAPFTVAGYTATIAGWDIDMGNALTPRSDPTKASGYSSCIITDRVPGGKFDPEMVTVATHDFFGRWKAGTTGALVIGDVGATQYNKVKINAPTLLYRKVSDADRKGIAVADINFQLAMNTGDDEIEIVFS